MIDALFRGLARLGRSFLFVVPVGGLVCLGAVLSHTPTQSGKGAKFASAQSFWYRGNTHAHTNNSDGDSSPHDVANRYRELGYNFLFITDHNKLTDVESLNAQLGVPGQFLVLKGEEITDSFNGKPVHLNGLNQTSVVAPQHGSDVLGTIENDLSAIRQAGGLAYVAHPNFSWAINATDLKGIPGNGLFEIFNAHPLVNNAGDATHPSTEAMWDEVLSTGKVLYGLVADDEHNLYKVGGALPGQAWIMVRASSLDADAITQAIERGDFYCSTGVTLRDYQASALDITVSVDPASGPATVDFIGRNGVLLQRTTNNPAVYTFSGHEQYVRAKIVNAAGQSAWTQPVFRMRLNAANAILNGAAVGHELKIAKSVAPDSIAIASGLGLANATLQAQRQPDGSFPTALAGTTVTVNGRRAEIYYASPSQVNFHLPPETELGIADVLVTNSDGIDLHCRVTVTHSAPGVFTEDGTGTGDAVVIDVLALLGSALYPNQYSRRLHLYATGVRDATEVTVLVNGQPVTIEAIKSCRGLPGLDQINIALSPDVLNPPNATVVIRTEAGDSNPVTLTLGKP